MSTLPRPTYYCARCRAIKPMAPSNDAMCPTCPDEPLVDVSDPDQRRSIEELEADAVDRFEYKWMAGVGIVLGLVGGGVGALLIGIGASAVTLYACCGAGVVGGVGLGRFAGRKLWRVGKRAPNLGAALALARPRAVNPEIDWRALQRVTIVHPW